MAREIEPLWKLYDSYNGAVSDVVRRKLDASLTVARAAWAAGPGPGLVEALERIDGIGTHQETNRVGDSYDLKGGYDDYEVVSPEAEEAHLALSSIRGSET